MRIIPAIDIIDGKCVRLSQGDYQKKKIYSSNPVEVAKKFEDHGIEYLHLVDLDGAKQSRVVNYSILEDIASKTSLRVDYGGGIRSEEDVKVVLESGARQLTGGSVAVKNPKDFERWLTIYGSDKIILGADAKDGKVATHGWQKSSELELDSFVAEWCAKGIEYVICTDISKDGMLDGPSIQLYEQLLQNDETGRLNLIASGGVTTMDDLYKLEEIGCEGAIIGKAIYESTIKLKDLRKFIEES
ncbi:1-(5-phosphoribosyl)-5-[(5-phosphoribosylamino)methylideneamino]imidazole-4-carboxamide isomerase [Nonlabens xiamenensis]|uniref:1-(5-phosphoribosyl)-5-[(5- phosphoribosylamino)methylideneamino]imidazole-4- carboxamide isomerase n=1 Tax=Nonlabens xiamenensis TaxID=2341043 RepID=UPI000F60A34A|nr:1-(5-phosphoribosyl)-5-[(5-phosphoribosylamino)methylideneamino]imidazole-4-carboxamide isomerase [Nonlabens xiamenensis]